VHLVDLSLAFRASNAFDSRLRVSQLSTPNILPVYKRKAHAHVSRDIIAHPRTKVKRPGTRDRWQSILRSSDAPCPGQRPNRGSRGKDGPLAGAYPVGVSPGLFYLVDGGLPLQRDLVSGDRGMERRHVK
jgi:hypothetical protein